jgi:hypothetical protein
MKPNTASLVSRRVEPSLKRMKLQTRAIRVDESIGAAVSRKLCTKRTESTAVEKIGGGENESPDQGRFELQSLRSRMPDDQANL